jgi:DNA-binding transcriptional MocR family regulator
VAGIVAQGPVLQRLRDQRSVEDCFLSGILQRTALELVTSKAWLGHVHALRHTLRERRDALLIALDRELPQLRLTRVPDGGFSLWLELPSHINEAQLVKQALQAGVHISPGAPWFAAESPGGFVRISTAGAPAPELLEGVSRLSGLPLLRAL